MRLFASSFLIASLLFNAVFCGGSLDLYSFTILSDANVNSAILSDTQRQQSTLISEQSDAQIVLAIIATKKTSKVSDSKKPAYSFEIAASENSRLKNLTSFELKLSIAPKSEYLVVFESREFLDVKFLI